MTHYFITGVSSGIGLALTHKLAALGHKVSGVARRQSRLDALTEQHEDFLACPADVSDSDQIASAINKAQAQNGPIDTAILNAGLYIPVNGLDIDPDVFNKHMQVNYMGVVNALAEIIPNMSARGQGHIVIIASVAGWVGLPKSAAYGPTKAALISLAESLWFDLTPKGIKIQVVCPGFVETEATAQNDFTMPELMTTDDAADKLIEGMKRDDFEITFPKSFTRMMRMMKWLPYSLYFSVIKKRTGL